MEQSKGNSLQRQLEACRAMCERHSWESDTSREIVDEGRSAFHGLNRAEGAKLWEFEREAEAGLYLNGHVFVVEHLDRISRQGWEAAYDFLKRLTGHGVTVATVDGERIYPAGERVPMGQVMEIIIKSELSLEEGLKKSKRIKAAWKAKRERAEAGDRSAITSITPSWIEVDRSNRKMRLVPHRAKVLNEIFEWSAGGLGGPSIVNRLNERNEPTWGPADNGWQLGYVTRLLTNRAVMGEYQPRSRPRGNSPEKAVPAGEPILDFYPPAITAELFNRVQAARAARRGTGGKRGKTQANLFSGIARCAECIGPMTYGSTRKAGNVIRGTSGSRKPITFVTKTDHSFLQCDNAKRRRGCPNKTKIRYEFIEPSILENMLAFTADSLRTDAPQESQRMKQELAELKRQIDGKLARLANLVDSFARTGSRTIEDALLLIEAEVEADKSRVETVQRELEQLSAAETPESTIEHMREIRGSLSHPDPQVRLDARIRVNQTLKRFINSMHCDANGQTMIVFGNYGAGITFDRYGNCADRSALNARYEGPDGEPDWHPDDVAAE
ncbi:recombinase family protein [Tsuneonella deserti]|nr:recombinase family protein [Tsuneonella deserti]